MPKNTFGGNKAKGFKNSGPIKETELVIKSQDQEYAKVVKLLGSNMVDLQCFDGVKRLGLIRGALRKKCWISLNDIVLIGLRDYQDNKCDILSKYSQDEVRNLIKLNQITGSFENSSLDNNKNNNSILQEISEPWGWSDLSNNNDECGFNFTFDEI